jgi:hypothetical protein
MLRRTIQDLIARYKLEPTLRDVYVEGVFDQRLLRLFFREIKCDRPTVNVIDLVEVPDAILAKYSMTRGERSELLVLANEIQLLLGVVPNFIAVVDADFDRLLGNTSKNPMVVTTDFTCMEMYWIDETTIQRFFTWIGRPERRLADFVNDIFGVARELFLIRCVLIVLGTGASMIQVRKYCGKAGNALTLDKGKYCNSLLLSAGAGARKTELMAETERLGIQLQGYDPRHGIHGHDLAELIYLAYRDSLSGLGLKDAASVETMIKMSMPIHRLDEYPLFQHLLSRVC